MAHLAANISITAFLKFNDSQVSNATSAIPVVERVANVIAVFPSLLIGTLGNCIVLLAMVTNSRRKQRYKSNAFVLMLAFTDLVFLLSAAFPNVTRYVSGFKVWPFAASLCKVFVFLGFSSANSGSMIIACFSITRLLSVCYPHSCASRMTFGRQVVGLAVVIVTSCAYSCIWLFNIGVVKSGECSFLYDRKSYVLIFLFDFALFFAIPVAVIIITNGILIHQILTLSHLKIYEETTFAGRSLTERSLNRISSKKSLQDSNKRPNSSNSGETSHRTTSSKGSLRYSPKRNIADGQVATKLLVTVAVVFTITCLPYRMLVVFNSLAPRPANTWITHMCRWLWYANSAINPIIYSLISKSFRDDVRKLLTTRPTVYLSKLARCKWLNKNGRSGNKNRRRQVVVVESKNVIVSSFIPQRTAGSLSSSPLSSSPPPARSSTPSSSSPSPSSSSAVFYRQRLAALSYQHMNSHFYHSNNKTQRCTDNNNSDNKPERRRASSV